MCHGSVLDYKTMAKSKTKIVNDANTWQEYAGFLKDIDWNGQAFGDEQVQKATAAGYTVDQVNDFLKATGTKATGNFAVGGYNDQMLATGAGDGAEYGSTKTPYYRFIGPTPAQPVAPPDPTSFNPNSIKTWTPQTAVGDNFDPNGLQIKSYESDPMIAQLQEMLINQVKPPDISQFTNQLSDIKASVQGLPGQLANQPGLGQGVSLDSFSKIFQQQVAASPGSSTLPSVNVPNGLNQSLSGYQGFNTGGQLGNNLQVFGNQSLSGYQGFNTGGQLGSIPKFSNPDQSIPNVQAENDGALSGLKAQFKQLTDMQNQAGWRAKAAMQIGSQSADSVQSASMSGPTGTDKLNRNQSGDYLNNLTIKNPINNTAAPTSSQPIPVASQPIPVASQAATTNKRSSRSQMGIKQDPEKLKRMMAISGRGI